MGAQVHNLHILLPAWFAICGTLKLLESLGSRDMSLILHGFGWLALSCHLPCYWLSVHFGMAEERDRLAQIKELMKLRDESEAALRGLSAKSPDEHS